MDRKDEQRGCTCGSKYFDLMRAPAPKGDLFRKSTCPSCEKVYWTNKDADNCVGGEPVTLVPSSGSGWT